MRNSKAERTRNFPEHDIGQRLALRDTPRFVTLVKGGVNTHGARMNVTRKQLASESSAQCRKRSILALTRILGMS